MTTTHYRKVSRIARSGAAVTLCMAVSLAFFGCTDAAGPDLDRDRGDITTYQRGTRDPDAATNGNAVLLWNDALLEAIRTTPIGPPQAARALAIVHTGMYDAWTAYDERASGVHLAGAMRRPQHEHTDASKREAVSYAAYRTLADLFPTRTTIFDAVMQQLGYDPANTTTDPRTPAGIGNVAAAELLTFRYQDGANQLGGYADYTGYKPYNSAEYVSDPERWQPLRNLDGTVQTFLAPHWQNVIPFGMTSASQFRPPAPAPYRSGEYHRQVQEVIDMSAKLTDREKMIVEYWADGPQSELPPGHWNLFAQLVSQRDGHSLDDDVKMFFALNHALCDASIAAWDAKRTYDYVRPITAIRYLKQGKKIRAWAGPYQGTQAIDGETWHPYQLSSFVTPPFAEYVSGHSTFSAAAAEVLRLFTGSDRFEYHTIIPAGSSRIEPGAVPAKPIVLSWTTFSEAADEAGLSRRYGGIHFLQGDLEGRVLGRKVGAAVWKKSMAYINGIP